MTIHRMHACCISTHSNFRVEYLYLILIGSIKINFIMASSKSYSLFVLWFRSCFSSDVSFFCLFLPTTIIPFHIFLDNRFRNYLYCSQNNCVSNFMTNNNFFHSKENVQRDLITDNWYHIGWKIVLILHYYEIGIDWKNHKSRSIRKYAPNGIKRKITIFVIWSYFQLNGQTEKSVEGLRYHFRVALMITAKKVVRKFEKKNIDILNSL